MDQQRIFIANLSKGKIGHDKANLLGSLLTTQFQLAAMARAAQPEEQRRDFHLFIDEFQNFSTEAFISILAEARKYRLCLTLSHQYVDQLPPAIRQAVFGNVGTMIAFRVGHADAEILSGEFGRTFTPKVFTELERFDAAVRLLQDGTNNEPIRLTTFPPLENRVARPDRLIAHCRQRLASDRLQVESKLARWAAPMERTE
jgi:hypothetical protein